MRAATITLVKSGRDGESSTHEGAGLGLRVATREEAMEALFAAQCSDIIEKLPEGADTVIGTHGTYLSGGEHLELTAWPTEDLVGEPVSEK